MSKYNYYTFLPFLFINNSLLCYPKISFPALINNGQNICFVASIWPVEVMELFSNNPAASLMASAPADVAK